MKNKSNNTSENVLRMLKFILQKDKFTIAEVINYFSDMNIALEQETVYKYIRTLKKAGFSFQKTDGKTYKLVHVPIPLSSSEIYIIEKMLMLMNTDFNMKSTKSTEKFLRFSPESICHNPTNFSATGNSVIGQKLEKYLKDNLRLEICFNEQSKTQEKIIFELHNIILRGDTVFLKGYNVSGKKPATYDFDKISEISQTPVKNKFLFGDKEAVIKFSAKISKSYNLKEGEQILRKTKNCLIIKTNYYGEEIFFRKILRYVDNSEILKPLYLREKFAAYVKNLYQMYDCHIYK